MRLRFRPPCLVEIVTSSGQSFLYYAVPVLPGLVRTIAIRSSARRVPLRAPAWLDHMRRNLLLEQDLHLMRTQQEAMRVDAERRGSATYASAWNGYHMPAGADRLVVEMRRWLEEFAPRGEDGEWFEFGEGEVEAAGGRMEGHVNTCAVCSPALKRLDWVIVASKAATAGAAVASVLAPEQAQRAACLLPVLVGAMVWSGCERLRRGFE